VTLLLYYSDTPTVLYCAHRSPKDPEAILWCSLSCVLSISQSSLPSVGIGTELLGCCPVASASGTGPATGGRGASGALASIAPDCRRTTGRRYQKTNYEGKAPEVCGLRAAGCGLRAAGYR